MQQHRWTLSIAPKAMLPSALVAATFCGTFCTDISAQETPLERLQNRSADVRWREATTEWLPVDKSQLDQSSSVKEVTTEQTPSQESSQSTPAPSVENLEQPEVLKHDFEFDTSFSLFEPFPNRGTTTTKNINSAQTTTKVVSPAKPFPTPVAQVPEPVEIEPTQDPIVSDNSKRKFQAPREPQRVAMLTQIPPAPSKTPELPLLRSISDIEPYHDYVPVKNRKNTSQMIKPINAEGPKYLPLPANGSLEAHNAPTYYHWMASNLTHDPLYFEDVSLERYGHTYPLQPFVSISKFGLQVIGLPYQMALNPVDCEQYALGYYRPGDCAPFLRYRIPYNKTAATTAAGVYTGLIFLIP
ncbi:hypothetical protein OAF74_00010 [bacterium]|nr:hypothetical protein [Planctomicrobium sp.]MDB4731193.1 hypothetical protein [bacterium]